MSQDFSGFRKIYNRHFIDEKDLPENPINLFQNWFDQVRRDAPQSEPNAMQLTTLDVNGYPHSRIVLLKRLDKNGFVFFTNYNSQKGTDIVHHPKVGLSFFWEASERQIIIKGKAKKTTREESKAYFVTRPRESKLGALASQQSRVVPSRVILEDTLQRMETEYPSTIPCPEHWGGYIVNPTMMEFWQGRPSRLHDRIRYTVCGENWKIDRLSP